MTASELLKQYVLDTINKEENSNYDFFEDLLESISEEKCPDYGEIEDVIYKNTVVNNTKHSEYSKYYVEQVIKINDKYIMLKYAQDDCWDKAIEHFNRTLKGINEAYFVEPYQELVTYYKAI